MTDAHRWPDAGPSATMSVDTVPASVSRVRHFVVAECEQSGTGAPCDTVALLVSEVATNALVHGCGRLDVRVLSHDRTLRVEVADGSPVLPRERHAAATDEGGRGLALVDALSSRWGVAPDAHGKTVWFELAS